MRGRFGLCMLLAATLVVGCAHKTPEQKAAAKAQKQAVAQAKAERKAADKQAKAMAKAEKKRLAEEQDRAEAQAKAAKKQADAQAKADKKRMEQEREQAAAQAKAQAKQAQAQAKIDRERATAQAKAEQQRQAEEQRIAQQKAAAAERAAREQADHDAFAQRQQVKMAMAATKASKEADKKADKKAKKTKTKKEKPVKYADDEEGVVGDPYIRPENHTRQTDRHFESMSAKGAVSDATLYDQHFDGTQLNALGRSKVALMLEAAPKNEPLTIYVPTVGSDERIQARLTAVQNFWKSSQYAAVEMQTKQGVNPNTATPAGSGLAALRRLEKEAGGNGGTGSSGVSASGGPGAGGGASGSTGR